MAEFELRNIGRVEREAERGVGGGGAGRKEQKRDRGGEKQ